VRRSSGAWPVPCAALTLSWICRSARALSEEERAAVEPFHGGALRLLRGGRVLVSGDNYMEFFLEIDVNRDDGSGHG
jgi:hypothetical protein